MDEEPTQPSTQPINADYYGRGPYEGLYHEELSDVICILHPATETTRYAIRDVPRSTPQHVLEKERYIDPVRPPPRDFNIALRLSSNVKDLSMGFCFGRGSPRSDILLSGTSKISNLHFRIFLNDDGVLMLEDCSTNGTIVDKVLLKAKGPRPGEQVLTTRTLQHGSRIVCVTSTVPEELAFTVKLPVRHGEEDEWVENFREYRDRVNGAKEAARVRLNARRMFGEQSANFTGGAEGQIKQEATDDRSNLDVRQNRQPSNTGHTVNGTAVEHPIFTDTKLPPKPRYRSNDYLLSAATSRPQLGRQWDEHNAEYILNAEIGKGAFASVFKAIKKTDGKVFAVKELEKRTFKKANIIDENVNREVSIMASLSHPNIVQYVNYINKKDFVYIVMEYVPAGNIAIHLKDRGAMLEEEVRKMTFQCLDALAYLHSQKVTHRDIKPDNILIASLNPLEVKLADFGLSKMLTEEQSMLTTFCGTLYYCAPEVYDKYNRYTSYNDRDPKRRPHKRNDQEQRAYDSSCDIWSLGAVVFHALTNRPPFDNCTDKDGMLKDIMTHDLDTSPLEENRVSGQGIDFTRTLLNRDPQRRPTEEACFRHSWLIDRYQRSWLPKPLLTTGNVQMIGENEEDWQGIDDDRKTTAFTEEDFNRVASQLSIADQHQYLTERVDYDEGYDDEFIGVPTQSREFAPSQAVLATNYGRLGQAQRQPPPRLPPTWDDAVERGDSDIWNSNVHRTSGKAVPGNRLFGEIAPSMNNNDLQAPRDARLPGQTTHGAKSLMGAEALIGQMNMSSPGQSASEVPASPRSPKTPSTRPLSPSSARTSKRMHPTDEEPGDLNETTPIAKRPRPFNRHVAFFPPDDGYWQPNRPETRDPEYCDRERAKSKPYQRWIELQKENYEDLVESQGSQPESCEEYVARMIENEKARLADGLEVWDEATKSFRRSSYSAASSSMFTSVPSSNASTVIVTKSENSFARPPGILGRMSTTPDSIATFSSTLTMESTTFGRERSCTIKYPKKTDTRIPKVALCIRFVDSNHPETALDKENISSEVGENIVPMLSTQARFGIWINDVHLTSLDEQGRPLWGRLFSGDRVTIYRDKPKSGDSENATAKEHLTVTVEFYRGGGIRARENPFTSEVVEPDKARSFGSRRD